MNIYQYIGTFVCLIFIALCATHAPVSEKLKSALWNIAFFLFIFVEIFQLSTFVVALIKYFREEL